MGLWFSSTLPAVPPLIISSNQELSITVGVRTLVRMACSSTFQIYGLAAAGGNQDGTVVTFQNVSAGLGGKFQFVNLSTHATSAVNKFKNGSGVAPDLAIDIGPSYGSITYRYMSSLLLWNLVSYTF